MWVDGVVGKLFAVWISIILSILALAAYSFSVNVIDSLWLQKQKSCGVVEASHHTPAWVQQTTIPNNNSSITIPIYHPDEWVLYVMVGDEGGWGSVSQETYDAASVGDDCLVTYMRGRLTGKIYIIKVTLP